MPGTRPGMTVRWLWLVLFGERPHGFEHDRVQLFVVVDQLMAVADIDSLELAPETGARAHPPVAEGREDVRAVRPDRTADIRAERFHRVPDGRIESDEEIDRTRRER